MVQRLGRVNLIWDKIELAVFFLQETGMSLLYIRETVRHLQNVALLGTNVRSTRRVLHHLIFVNIFISSPLNRSLRPLHLGVVRGGIVMAYLELCA